LQVETGIWFYLENITWRAARILPEKHKRAHRMTSYKVILHFTGSNPTLHHHINKVKYPCRAKRPNEKKEGIPKVKHSKNKFRCFYIPLDENEDIEELIF
jgi:hypothetical protein